MSQATACFVQTPPVAVGGGAAALPESAAAAFAEPWDPRKLPLSSSGSFGRAVCPSDSKQDLEWRRRVWLANIDDDEFAYMRDGSCITDFLPRFTEHGCLFMQVMVVCFSCCGCLITRLGKSLRVSFSCVFNTACEELTLSIFSLIL